jgi:outer membrane protein OmpA-like peptidoglycan-associated protein
MIKSRKRHSCVIVLPIAMALITSACASKKYVNQQVSKVNQNVAQFENKTNDRIAYINNEQKSTTAQLNGRLNATDQKLSAMATTVQQTQGTASRAMEEASASRAPSVSVAKPPNYQLVNKTDVLFGFNKSNLTQKATASLDDVVNKFQSTSGAVIELAGYTDPIGTAAYNLDLSRRRAWAVQRYLVDHNVPLRSIHVVGMGEEMPPGSETGSKSERNQMARRVNIRVYEASRTAGGSDTDQ